ncbi:hypothetical protein ACFQY4_05365 [Catellatospora bangladeshensis]|nr:hypothetical protein [Catellatospora bangladeshensis]
MSSRTVGEVCRRTGHALGNVKSAEVEALPQIADWNPPFAFTFVLHHLTERSRSVPTWDEFRVFFRHDPVGRLMLGRPIDDAKARSIEQGLPASIVDDALRWRVGNAYYSFLRELWLLVRLREHGIPLQIHPLADAVFKVDAWFGRIALNIYIRNAHYRDDEHGRKVATKSVLQGADPAFLVENVRLERARKFGKVHLPDETDIRTVVQRLRRSTCRPAISTPAEHAAGPEAASSLELAPKIEEGQTLPRED